MKGKIISVVGAPGTGKSFLAKKIAKHYKAKLFLEGEEKDAPKKIISNLAKVENQLETNIWFRNKLVNEFLKAKKIVKTGKNVVMDTFWLSNRCYINPLMKGFEKEIAIDVSKLDEKILNYPNIIILVKSSKNSIREFIKKRGRSFDQSKHFLEMCLKVQNEHIKLFKKKKFNTIIINRQGLDFNNTSDFKEIIKKINT